jgi:S-DNA-T family DNA segregation ATPase FtsK/SpoIIIE
MRTGSVLGKFGSGLAFRILVSICIAFTDREWLYGCADLDAPPSRLVVIDEFHELMVTHPRAADLLEHLTAMGTSLGVRPFPLLSAPWAP